MLKRRLTYLSLVIGLSAVATASHAQQPAAQASIQTAPGVVPGSINCEECPYPAPSSYFPVTAYGQDLRMAFMDVGPTAPANGHTVVLFHGNNFAGFYFGGLMDALSKQGFRVIAPDQIGYGRSSKAIVPYGFNDWSRYTSLLLKSLQIEKAMIVGHSMGGMLAARFATQYPAITERLVLYNPIGLTDERYSRPVGSIDDQYKQSLSPTFASIEKGLMRYVAHRPAAWNAEFERYARIRYSWTLGGEWPRLAMVQTLIAQVPYSDPVVYDWAHIEAPTLVFGGAEDMLAGTPAKFQERMKYISETILNGKARLLLLPGLGHVPHLESPGRTYPPLVAFLKEGVAAK